ncbi:MAG: Signal transduction histidine-protein kinase BarA, partial [Segetibacter sp.]|nr:Signal transduction histidine-protein kinase BarA [Segetibacter sp.]
GALLELNKGVEQKDPYSLVLLDISLATQMDGHDVATEIQKDPLLKSTAIIVISMSQKASDRERFGSIGITHFFSKPFSQSDLLDTIQNMFVSSNSDFVQHTHSSDEMKVEIRVSSGSLKILLVEDNVINQDVAFSMLTKRGHSVTISNNGLEALEVIQSESFDIILMDVQMPKMNGYDATHKIREIEKKSGSHTHIIGLTANAMKGDEEKCLEKGMDGYLSKPLRFDDMDKAIQRFKQKLDRDMKDKGEEKDAYAPVVNLNALFERLDGDEEIFEQFMNKIPGHISTSFEKLVEAINSKSSEDIEYTAHSLRGLCLNLEMHKVTDITLTIEKLATEYKLNDIDLLVSQLENELLKALNYIKEHRDLISEAV